MIREFTVENFMSIKEAQTISFETTSDKTSEDYLTYEISPKVRLLKMAIIYGSNASGKSNILIALETAFRMLINPEYKKDEPILYEPFALRKDEPTTFKLSFYIGSIKYDYSISYDKFHILREKLDYSPNGVNAKFYERNYTSEDSVPKITFGNLNLSAKTKNSLTDNTFNNHTLLSTYGKISVEAEPFKIIFNWIKNNAHNINENESILDITKSIIEDNEKKSFIMKALCKADFNISELKIVEKKREIPKSLREFITNDSEIPTEEKERILKEIEEEVIFTHNTSTENFSLSQRLQSSGTSRYLKYLDHLYKMTKENHIYIYDEIERGLHYDLLIYYLSLFMMNTQSSQIIIATHDQMLLDEDFIRRDMVWFTEKSKETGATDLYCASEFGLHKNISLYKAYKTGRLGAKPELGSIYIDK